MGQRVKAKGAGARPTKGRGKRGPDKRPRKPRRDGNHGGPRGGGRPKGSGNSLPKGAVEALKTTRWEVPPKAPAEAAELAGDALETIVDVMKGKVPTLQMSPRLKAAVHIREMVCGAIVRKVQVSGSISMGPRIKAARERAGLASAIAVDVVAGDGSSSAD